MKSQRLSRKLLRKAIVSREREIEALNSVLISMFGNWKRPYTFKDEGQQRHKVRKIINGD